MKKKFALILGLVLLLGLFTACGPKVDYEAEVGMTLAELKEANRVEFLLKQYEYFSLQTQLYDAEGKAGSKSLATFYKDNGYLQKDYELYGGDGKRVMTSAYRKTSEYSAQLTNVTEMGAVAAVFPAADYKVALIGSWMENDDLMGYTETVREAQKEGNQIVFKTLRKTKNDWGKVYITYAANADTKQLINVTYESYDANGKFENRIVETPVYGGKMVFEYDAAKEFADLKNPCTVEIVLSPGSEDEETIKMTVFKGALVSLNGRTEYKLYKDAACTEAVETIDTSVAAAVKVYAKPVK
ncbi:MAG: hypothetical protein IJC68_03410 [Firmicutes bacterium]|nr:hypothetical protein [Bacillota bacterium]